METSSTNISGIRSRPETRPATKRVTRSALLLGMVLLVLGSTTTALADSLTPEQPRADWSGLVMGQGDNSQIAETELDRSDPHSFESSVSSGELSAQTMVNSALTISALTGSAGWHDSAAASQPQTVQWSSANRYELARHKLGQGTRLTGWQLGDGLYFGRSKGELSGVALIWQPSQTQQVSLSGAGLRLTRRLR